MGGSLFRRAAVVQRVSYRLKRQVGCCVRRSKRTRAGSSCLRGGGTALKLYVRAVRYALVMVGFDTNERHYTGGRLLSFNARPWYDVSTAASNAKLASRVRSKHGLTLAVSGEVAQHSSLPGARAAPRWLWSA